MLLLFLKVILIMLAIAFFQDKAIAQTTTEMPSYGEWVCDLWVRSTGWLPQTPQEYWISNLALRVGDNLPFIGRGIFNELLNQIKMVLAWVVTWKIFKSMAGRF